MRRSKLETYIDVLEVIASGRHKPTRIMYKANLSWNPMQRYLKHLVKQGLILAKTQGERTRYEITQKGLVVLSHFVKARQEISV